MRAAFKAVNDHKQVAVLVPTTVLAQQHYANFKERFESFAVEVAVLSRFQSKAEQKETLEKLKKRTSGYYYWNSPALVQRCCFFRLRLNRDR